MVVVGLLMVLAGCDLAITKVASPDPATVGKTLTYTLEVTNNPPDAPLPPEGPGSDGVVPNALVADQLPESVKFVSATPSQGECEKPDADGTVFCTLGELELDQSETVRIAVVPEEAGRIRNTATTLSCPFSDAEPELDENGNLTCSSPATPTAEQNAQMQEIQELQEAQSGEITAQGIVEPNFCGIPDSPFNPEGPLCDPQEDNSVTISTRVLEGDGCTITGTERKDNIRGTSGDDVICGLGGNDNIVGLGGDDIIRGGGGNDSITGNKGDDTLLGEAGNDHLFGGPGTDRLVGGPGNNKLVQ